MYDATQWANKCGIIDQKSLNLATFDRLFISTNVTCHSFFNSAERDLNRYEFMEFIVRIASCMYLDTNVVSTHTEAIEKLMRENILPYSQESLGQLFRQEYIYNLQCDLVLSKNAKVLKQLFGMLVYKVKRVDKLVKSDKKTQKCNYCPSGFYCNPCKDKQKKQTEQQNQAKASKDVL